MAIQRIGKDIVWLDKVDSTNLFAERYATDDYAHGVVVATTNQTHGRGQRGNQWESNPGDNLLFSIVLKPTFLLVQRQFLISKITALAIVELLSSYTSGLSIKWPNDIYVNSCKISGVLIENSFHSEYLDTTIVGIGINVNQSEFSDELPNPTSLYRETGKAYDLNTLLNQFCQVYQRYYNALQHNSIGEISRSYFEKLFRSDGYSSYTASGQTFRARIIGVRDTGELVLETDSGERKEFAFKEVAFVI